MDRFVALTTVPDQGAAEVIGEALSARGIEAQISRVRAEHPYKPVSLESVRILVPEERFEEANGVLAALQLEVARDFRAQSGAGDAAGRDDPAPELEKRALWRVSFATVWLGFLVPIPITCLLVRARLAASIFLGLFVGVLVTLDDYDRGTAPISLFWWLLGAKIGDLLVALVVSRRRNRVSAGG